MLDQTTIANFDAERRKREAHRIPISGANATDLELAENAVSLIENLALSALMGQMGNINENLSSPIPTTYAYEMIREGFKDLRDALNARQG